MLRENYFVEAACSYSLNWVLFWLFLVCFVFLFCFVCLYVCLFCHKHQAWRFDGVSMIPMLILFVFSFLFFFFETDETAIFDSFGPHRNHVLVPGIDILMIVMKREAEAGGIVIVTVLSGQISTRLSIRKCSYWYKVEKIITSVLMKVVDV